MIEIQVRIHGASARSCATCVHYNTLNTDDGREPYCTYNAVSLKKHAHELTKTFCVRYDPLPNQGSISLYQELTGMRP